MSWEDDVEFCKKLSELPDEQKAGRMYRLKTCDSLGQAIRTGSASTDLFGIAYELNGEVFEGFQLGGGASQFDNTLLPIEPESAKSYQDELVRTAEAKKVQLAVGADRVQEEVTWAGTSTSAPNVGPTTTSNGSATVTSGPLKTTFFHGSVRINPSTAKLRLVQLAEEIISLLANDPNTTLDVTAEINEEFPSGASDQTKRAVSENARSLGLKSRQWD